MRMRPTRTRLEINKHSMCQSNSSCSSLVCCEVPLVRMSPSFHGCDCMMSCHSCCPLLLLQYCCYYNVCVTIAATSCFLHFFGVKVHCAQLAPPAVTFVRLSEPEPCMLPESICWMLLPLHMLVAHTYVQDLCSRYGWRFQMW